MSSSQRTLQEYRTTLAPGDVLALAKQYFARRHGIYATFVEQESPTHVTFRGQGTEEIVVAAAPEGTGSRVSGSAYLFDMQVARFFATLPASESETATEAPAATVAAEGTGA